MATPNPGKVQVGPAQYGGLPGGAAAAKDEGLERVRENDGEQAAIRGGANYANQQASQGRPGATMDPTAAANQASGANGNQAGAVELARRQAMGLTPGAGVQSLQRNLAQTSQQQSAMAAGARGSAGIAVAQQNAAANKSNLQQNAFSGAGMMRSQDMAAGRGLYGTLTGQARAQDQQALGYANEFGQANAKAADDYQLGMGKAAVGFGQVANAQNNEDFINTRNSFDPIYAQDDAHQDGATWEAEKRKQNVADNQKDASTMGPS